MFNSIEEICEKFSIPNTEDVENIIKQLTDIQASLHPDRNPNYQCDESIREKYNEVTQAKEFLKNIKKNNSADLISIKDVSSLIKEIRDYDLPSRIEKVEQSFDKVYNDQLKEISITNRPKKIALGTAIGLVSGVWAFPSVITDNPMFTYIIDRLGNKFYLDLTIIWLSVLVVSTISLFYIWKNEIRKKNSLYIFNDINYQYNIFEKFVKEKKSKQNNNSEISFTKSDLESFILQHTLVVRSKPFESKRHNRKNKHYSELIPNFAELIIQRALQQGVIKRSDDISWYDKYIVIDSNAF